MRFDDAHERARYLIDESRVGGISAEESGWLRGHLAGCGECARREESTGRMLRAMGELQFEGVKPPKRRLQPRLAAPLLVAAAVLIAAIPLYKAARDEADARLLERVGTHVSRSVPQALEPLMDPETGGYR